MSAESRSAHSFPLDYSLRRKHVDDFFVRHAAGIAPGSHVLDVGGTRLLKRGAFNIEALHPRVTYVNISPAKAPDAVMDAAALALHPNVFDAAICAEVLEHVPDPRAVLAEIARVLRPGGTLLITVPFLYRIHADPFDFGRYTDHFWRDALAKAGFEVMALERQGLFWTVLVEMLRAKSVHLITESRQGGRIRRSLTRRFITWARRRAGEWDAGSAARGDAFDQSFTTGFGIVARKAGP